MPWHLPAELQHFKRVTMGRPVVMGRKTWEAIGRALPGRRNIVVTRSATYEAAGAECAGSLQAAIELAGNGEIMVIGGGELYRLALPLASRLVVTRVDCAPEGDTWFPAWQASEWELLSSESFEADELNPCAYEIDELRRISVSGP